MATPKSKTAATKGKVKIRKKEKKNIAVGKAFTNGHVYRGPGIKR